MVNDELSIIENIRILVIADIIGRPGRRTVARVLPGLKRSLRLDLIIANGENAAGGLGCTAATAQEFFKYGIDILTMGNHVWDKEDFADYIQVTPQIVRPANFPPGSPGKGHYIVEIRGYKIAVINLQGRMYMDCIDCPFQVIEKKLEQVKFVDIILIDMHAEAASEKMAIAHYLDGKVAVIWGTHTHVQTADLKLLPNGTLYVTDLGMTGPVNSVIGIKKELVIKRLVTGLPVRFEVPGGDCKFQGLFVEINRKGIPVSYKLINDLVYAEGK